MRGARPPFRKAKAFEKKSEAERRVALRASISKAFRKTINLSAIFVSQNDVRRTGAGILTSDVLLFFPGLQPGEIGRSFTPAALPFRNRRKNFFLRKSAKSARKLKNSDSLAFGICFFSLFSVFCPPFLPPFEGGLRGARPPFRKAKAFEKKSEAERRVALRASISKAFRKTINLSAIFVSQNDVRRTGAGILTSDVLLFFPGLQPGEIGRSFTPAALPFRNRRKNFFLRKSARSARK